MRLCIGLLSVLALVSSLACDSDRRSPTEPPPTEVGSVTFEYHASTANDPEIREAFPDCWSEAGRSHLHPSWRDFRDARLEPQGEDLWTATLDDVPVGREQLVYLADRNTCSADNPHGTVTTDLSANGVLLVRIVEMDVHGGPKQNLAFTLSSDGTVSP